MAGHNCFRYFAPAKLYIKEANNDLRGGTTALTIERTTQVVLLVYDRASVRLLYRTEAQGQTTNRRTLLKGPFSRLVKDIRELGH